MIYHFKGIKEDTPEEIANKKRRKQKQEEFLRKYKLYRDKLIQKEVNDTIKEFINRPS
tara:strand:+ start:5004 stop:5177 length:174 start_codon:yes stop_codon:yes gene_type:complete